MWKYCEGFAAHVKKDDNAILWFLLYFFVGIIMPAIVQSELNKLATVQGLPSRDSSGSVTPRKEAKIRPGSCGLSGHRLAITDHAP
jgi:hypothetical protein